MMLKKDVKIIRVICTTKTDKTKSAPAHNLSMCKSTGWLCTSYKIDLASIYRLFVILFQGIFTAYEFLLQDWATK